MYFVRAKSGRGSVSMRAREGSGRPLRKDGYARTVHCFEKAGHYVVRVARTNRHGFTAIARLQVRVSED